MTADPQPKDRPQRPSEPRFPWPTETAQARTLRAEAGRRVLDAVDGAGGGSVVDSLADIAPELGHQIVAHAFGDLYARPQLGARQRQLVTLGVLTALGGCEPQLRVHIGAALNVGLTPDEIIEAAVHASVYCGFPRALNAVSVAREVFAERGVSVTPEEHPAP